MAQHVGVHHTQPSTLPGLDSSRKVLKSIASARKVPKIEELLRIFVDRCSWGRDYDLQAASGLLTLEGIVDHCTLFGCQEIRKWRGLPKARCVFACAGQKGGDLLWAFLEDAPPLKEVSSGHGVGGLGSEARQRCSRLGNEAGVRQKFSGDEAMQRVAPGIEALVIGVHLR
jgi:hypothetical protein